MLQHELLELPRHARSREISYNNMKCSIIKIEESYGAPLGKTLAVNLIPLWLASIRHAPQL